MQLRKLQLRDQEMVQRFFAARPAELSAYSHVAVYAGGGLHTVFWCIIDGNLCVFFKDAVSCFLFVPPLGQTLSRTAIAAAFDIMDHYNRNPAVSRIENVSQAECAQFEELGYKCRHAFDEYVYKRAELAGLRGDRFKSKRASVNFFRKHYQSSYQPFSPDDIRECRFLYRRWSRERAETTSDRLYQGMLKDSAKTFDTLLPVAHKLGAIGRLVRVDNRIVACTFGYALNPETFCVLFEIADLAVKGASQYIFMRLCQELVGFRNINCMDDSGLKNLKAVKLSYHPQRLVPSFVVTRQDV